MNFANDLLKKAAGNIELNYLPAQAPQKLASLNNDPTPDKGNDYVNELGQPCFKQQIATKYRVSPAKVKDLFDKYPPYLVYKLIGTDQRASNGKYQGRGKVYALPSGEWCTSQQVADFYRFSRSVIQRAWVDYNKDPVKANQYLMSKFFSV
jgi:hypothetical protein